MKKRVLLVSLLVITLIISFFLFKSSNLKSKRDAIVDKIEMFKQNNNRLPSSLKEIGIDENINGPFFYEKNNSTNSYIIWYGTILGESVTYDSTTNKWDD